MIQLLKLSELKAWTPIAAEYHDLLGMPGVFSADAFVSTWKALIDSRRGFVIGRFVDSTPREVVGVMIYPDPFTGELSAGAVFWYQSEFQANLASGWVLHELINECKRRQVKRLFVSIPQRRISPDIVNTLGALGFENVETQYMRDV